MLKASNLGKTAVLFIITKRATHAINPLCMEKRGILNELEEITTRISQGTGKRLFTRAASGGPLKLDDLVDEYWMLRYRRAQSAFKREGLPLVVTHMLQDDANDPVLNHIRMLNLVNHRDDPAKVVYHPDFISPHNRLWGMEYDQFVRGCHMGLFPSMYEPWGYTPLESAAMGIPSVTSDLAGFGRYAQESYANPNQGGTFVLKRRSRGFHDAASDLSRIMFDFCKMERRDRIALRNEVDKRSWDFDWSKLGRAYHTTHELAINRLRAGDVARIDPSKPMSRLQSVGMVSADVLAKSSRQSQRGNPGSAQGAPPNTEVSELKPLGLPASAGG
jgi:glycogen(starch) synthase